MHIKFSLNSQYSTIEDAIEFILTKRTVKLHSHLENHLNLFQLVMEISKLTCQKVLQELSSIVDKFGIKEINDIYNF